MCLFQTGLTGCWRVSGGATWWRAAWPGPFPAPAPLLSTGRQTPKDSLVLKGCDCVLDIVADSDRLSFSDPNNKIVNRKRTSIHRIKKVLASLIVVGSG